MPKIRPVHDKGKTLRITMTVEARSLDLPVVDGHPNRMPFSGILTKVDVASDSAPSGSNGKRVLLTREAVESALDSLLGMGVGLTKDFRGHDVQNKVGVITNAWIDGNDLRIEGFIYAADFPQEALRIHLEQADLGFSFEARNIAVESMDSDPLVITSIMFTGAAILMKDAAAYSTTALAASKAKEHEVEEMNKTVAEAIATALGPIAKQLADVVAAQGVVAATIEELKKLPPKLETVIAGRIEPHALAMDTLADALAKDGIGMHPSHGHVANLRWMASSLRADAASGKLPQEFAAASAPTPPKSEVDIKDSPEFKALQAQIETLKATHTEETQKVSTAQVDAVAALETQLKDLKAQMTRKSPEPQRKTLSNEANRLVERYNLEMPKEGEMIHRRKLDEMIASAGITDTHQRMNLKQEFVRAGLATEN